MRQHKYRGSGVRRLYPPAPPPRGTREDTQVSVAEAVRLVVPPPNSMVHRAAAKGPGRVHNINVQIGVGPVVWMLAEVTLAGGILLAGHSHGDLVAVQDL